MRIFKSEIKEMQDDDDAADTAGDPRRDPSAPDRAHARDRDAGRRTRATEPMPERRAPRRPDALPRTVTVTDRPVRRAASGPRS